MGRGGALTADLDNTPLGVADGAFRAETHDVKTADGQPAVQYLSQSAKRNISVVFGSGRVLETTVSPQSEATPLSLSSAVPAGVLPLTEGFRQIAEATTCPAGFTMYDGRRVVQIATAAKTSDGASDICTMDYRVTAGPGHLSPFRFKSLGMTLTYTGGRLAEMNFTAGGFELRFTR